MLKTKILRPAIAMLELIFAIVIMGIILMSAPQLISTAAKSGYVAIQQEAINEAASQVNMIMGYHWDESNTNEEYIPPILITSGDNELNEVNISAEPTGRRLGTPEESYRAFVRSDGQRFSASTLGDDTGDTEEDDIDDFAGSTNLVEIEPAGMVDNVEKTTINIATAISYSEDNVSSEYNQSTISYNPFATSGGTTNIKSIIVTLTSVPSATVPIVPDELDKEIILRAFSCNIGGYKLEEKEF